MDTVHCILLNIYFIEKLTFLKNHSVLAVLRNYSLSATTPTAHKLTEHLLTILG